MKPLHFLQLGYLLAFIPAAWAFGAPAKLAVQGACVGLAFFLAAVFAARLVREVSGSRYSVVRDLLALIANLAQFVVLIALILGVFAAPWVWTFGVAP